VAADNRRGEVTKERIEEIRRKIQGGSGLDWPESRELLAALDESERQLVAARARRKVELQNVSERLRLALRNTPDAMRIAVGDARAAIEAALAAKEEGDG